MIPVEDFAADARAWFTEHTPRNPGFMLPLTFMEVGTDEQFAFLRDWQAKVHAAGYLGAAWPKEYGGGGLTEAHQRAATNAMREQNAPIMLNAIGIGWAGPLILDTGTEAQKRRYLPGILSADDIWCQGFSEPDNGSDLGNAQLKAVRDGDEYVLNGSKIWTTQGNYARYMILLARTNPDSPNKYAGLSFFLAPMDVPGISTTKIRKLTGEFGGHEDVSANVRHVEGEAAFGLVDDGFAPCVLDAACRNNRKACFAFIAHGGDDDLARIEIFYENLGLALDICKVPRTAWLKQRDRSCHVIRDAPQPVLLLHVRTACKNGLRGERRADEWPTHEVLAHSFHDGDDISYLEAEAFILFRDSNGEPAEFTHLVPNIGVISIFIGQQLAHTAHGRLVRAKAHGLIAQLALHFGKRDLGEVVCHGERAGREGAVLCRGPEHSVPRRLRVHL